MINDSKDILSISWELVGLDCKMDLDYDLDSLQFVQPSSDKISKFLIKYGFKSLYKRVEDLFQMKIVDNVSVAPTIEEKIVMTRSCNKGILQ
jgi:DNA polymerase-1